MDSRRRSAGQLRRFRITASSLMPLEDSLLRTDEMQVARFIATLATLAARRLDVAAQAAAVQSSSMRRARQPHPLHDLCR